MKTIVYLEGQDVLDHSSYVDECLDTDAVNHYNHIVLDDLYKNEFKLVAVKYLNPDFIHIKTTGLHKDKIKYLIKVFSCLDYVPKGVIFYNERVAMLLLDLARELKESGTKFYYLHRELKEINWI